MQKSRWIGLLVLVIASKSGLAQDPAPPPLAIGTRTCLFLDDRFIESATGLKRTWHQGKPQAAPAIEAREPWEKWPHLFGSVLYDPQTKLYKMWYEDLPGPGAVFYAESKDGKTWMKPKLGLIELRGSKANNCVLLPAELPNVFLDPNTKDANSRYCMLAWCNNVPAAGKKWAGHVLWRSGDGIHWRPDGNFPLPETSDAGNPRTVRDTDQVAWDPLGQRYLGTFRTFPLHPKLPGWFRDDQYKMTVATGGHRRGVGVAMSKSLTDRWPRIVTVLQADARDDARVHQLSKGPTPDFAELYIMPFWTLGNHYLGAVSLLYHVDGMNDTVDGGGDLQLTFSHDGIQWHRHPERQTLIASSPSKLIPVYAVCNAPLEIGDETWLYYTEAESAHPKPEHKATIRAATWRKDGFVSMDAGGQGSLTTPLLRRAGNALMLNFQTAAEGQVRVALLDPMGKELAGFGVNDCVPLRGDAVGRTVGWKSKANLKGLPDSLRLRFEVSHGRLWSFRLGDAD